jgi:hypothetical protein
MGSCCCRRDEIALRATRQPVDAKRLARLSREGVSIVNRTKVATR